MVMENSKVLGLVSSHEQLISSGRFAMLVLWLLTGPVTMADGPLLTE